MTILRIKIAVLLLLCSLAGARAQVRPDQFPLQTNIEGANFEIYSQYNGVNTKTLPIYMKEYFVPNVDSAWQAFTFTDSIGIADSLRMMFLKDNRGRVFYVDADGDALLLKDTAQAVGNVYVLATTADTTTVSSPVEGDIAYVQDTSRLLVYETYWLVFSGGGSGSATFERFEISGDTLYAALTGDAVPDLFVVLSSYLDNTDAQTLVFDTATAQLSITGGNTVSLDGLFAKGSGTTNTLPMWVAWDSLGNSAVTQSGQEIAMGLTGALTVPSGTDAEVPVWGAGKLRFNTTINGFQGGPSGYYLPYSNTPSFTSGSVLFSNGSRVVDDNSGLFYDAGSDELRIGGNTDRGNYDLQLNGQGIYIQSAYPALYINQGRIEFANNNTVLIDANPVNFIGTFLDVNHQSTNNSSYGAKIFARSWPVVITNPVGSASGFYPLHVGYNRTTVNYAQKAIVISNAETPNLDPTSGSPVALNGSLDLSWEYKFDGAPDYRYEAAKISPQVIDYTQGAVDISLNFFTLIDNVLTHVSKLDSAGFHLLQYGSGNITGTPTYSASFDSNGKLIEVSEQWGTISTSTDASGDIVVAHGMGTTPTSVQVTVTGTTPYVVTVHTIDATNFTVRFFDMAGAAVTSTAVTATWHCKT